jgi:hypothetical protein
VHGRCDDRKWLIRINGYRALVVSQLHHVSVFFEHDRGKTIHPVNCAFLKHVLFTYRGSCGLDFEFDLKDYLYFRVDLSP